jgi:hypothetical protein
MHALDNGLAFGDSSACYVKIAQHVVVLRAFMRHDLCDATSADDKNIAFHVSK